MSNLSLSEEREQFQKLASEFAQGEITPIAEEFDKSGQFPESLVEKAWEIGLVNFQIPEELGGLNLGCLDSSVILEELASGCSGISAAIEATTIAQLSLIQFGTDEQKKQFLEPLTQECSVAGYASQDATADSIEVSVSDSELTLNGTHSALINGENAAWFLLIASHTEFSDDESQEIESTALIVPRDTPGVTIQNTESILGRKARSIATVSLDNVKLTTENVIGEVGAANNVIHSILPQIYCFVASGAIGVAKQALKHAIQYSKERTTFGRPIAKHQGIAFMLAEMAREIEAARYMTWQAACLIDEGKNAHQQALSAKAYAQDVAMRVTTDAVQVYGGYGYSKEYPVEKLMRDAKVYQLSEQSPFELKSALARELVGCI